MQSSNYNIAFSIEEVILSDLGEKYAQIKHLLQVKTVLNKNVDGFWCERTKQKELFHWRKQYYGL